MKRVSLSQSVQDEDVKAFYIITVDGIQMPGGQRGGGGAQQASAGPHRLPAEQADRLKAATTLGPKGKDPVNPAQIVVATGENGKMTVRYYFPRSADFSLDDREIVFTTRVGGRMEVKQKFTLKDMTFDGKLAL